MTAFFDCDLPKILRNGRSQSSLPGAFFHPGKRAFAGNLSVFKNACNAVWEKTPTGTGMCSIPQ